MLGTSLRILVTFMAYSQAIKYHWCIQLGSALNDVRYTEYTLAFDQSVVRNVPGDARAWVVHRPFRLTLRRNSLF